MALKMSPLMTNDRLLSAIGHAPLVQGTAEEQSAFEQGLKDIQAGRVLSATEVRGSIQMRERDGE